MLSPALTSWRAHYDRLQRSFFQDCFHLKDWIKNDPASGAAAQIEEAVQAELPLRIAADLANAAKHLERTMHREGAYVTSTNVTVHLGQNKPADIEYVVTLADGSTLVAQQVAKDAMASWAAVLARLGLKR